MNCNVIKDLIPLYIDECCSEESMMLVREHLASCPSCASAYARMNSDAEMPERTASPIKMGRVREWKASVLQSALLFSSFLLIVIGVALEAATPFGARNGCWALALIIPATALMLSLANWFFVRIYKSRKSFVRSSPAITLCIAICGYLWSVFHYGLDVLKQAPMFLLAGLAATAVFCIVSRLLSERYALMLGKD